MPKKAIKKEAKYVCCKCGYDNTPLFEVFLIPITKEIIKKYGIDMAIKNARISTLKEVLEKAKSENYLYFNEDSDDSQFDKDKFIEWLEAVIEKATK